MKSPFEINKIRPKCTKTKKAKSEKMKPNEISTQVRSAPASPVSEASKMEIEPIAIQPISANKNFDVASSSSSSVSSSSRDLTPPSTPSYTPAEQKFIDTIQSVSQRIDRFAFDLPSIDRQITRHLTKLCLYHWHPHGLSFDAEKLNMSHKQLYYNAGMVDENVLQQIFCLDSIQTENDQIRKLRKAQVAKGNEIIKKSLVLRQRLDRMKRLLPHSTAPKAEPIQTSENKIEQEKSNESMESIEMIKDENEVEAEDKKESISNVDEDDIETDNLNEEDGDEPMKEASNRSPNLSSPSPSRSSSQSPKTLSPFERKYAHLDLPTYSGPSFQARENPYTGVLVIESDIDGIHPSDLSVTHDLKDRTLTIRGVRLPDRRHSVQHPFHFFGRVQPQRIQPFGHFKKVIHLNQVDPHGILSLANLEAVVDPRQNKLQITLPRAQPQTQPRPHSTRQAPSSYSNSSHQPLRSRAPVYTSTGYDYSSEDEPDHFSHPFGSFFARPHPMRQQYQPAHNPFGEFW